MCMIIWFFPPNYQLQYFSVCKSCYQPLVSTHIIQITSDIFFSSFHPRKIYILPSHNSRLPTLTLISVTFMLKRWHWTCVVEEIVKPHWDVEHYWKFIATSISLYCATVNHRNIKLQSSHLLFILHPLFEEIEERTWVPRGQCCTGGGLDIRLGPSHVTFDVKSVWESKWDLYCYFFMLVYYRAYFFSLCMAGYVLVDSHAHSMGLGVLGH